MTKYISLRHFTAFCRSGSTHTFNKGDIYFMEIDFVATDATYFSVFSIEKKFIIKIWLNDIDDCFITFAKWRDKQIESIIND